MGFSLRGRFHRASVVGGLMAGLLATGCNGNNNQTLEHRQDALIRQMEQRQPINDRLHRLLEDQKDFDGFDPENLAFLASHNIALDLSADGLPDGAMIRLFKNRWQINPFMPAKRQSWAVHLAIEYAEGQEKDGLSFGAGESFSVPALTLTPVGKTVTARPQP